MKLSTIILIFSACVIYSSCERKEKENPEECGNSCFEVKVLVNSLTCYPNDSISLEFQVEAKKGKEPYSIIWLNPDSLKGFGPFTFEISSNLFLNARVMDGDKKQVEITHEVLKDTIDQLQFDYRNNILGSYDCMIIHNWGTEVAPGVFETHSETYKDTIVIMKHENFAMLKVSPDIALNYDFSNSSFSGYHISGNFSKDSIFMYSFSSPVALHNFTYKGKKLE